jgi:hypothetical protein
VLVLFTCLIVVQFVVVTFHDLVDVPGWTHGSQVQAVIGRGKVWLVTLANGVFPGIAVAFAIYSVLRTRPPMAANYWVIYCAVTLLSAIFMWYVPYLWGGSERQRQEYRQMYAGTKQVLPARGENPRPNLLHVCFHVLFVATFALALVLRFRPR